MSGFFRSGIGWNASPTCPACSNVPRLDLEAVVGEERVGQQDVGVRRVVVGRPVLVHRHVAADRQHLGRQAAERAVHRRRHLAAVLVQHAPRVRRRACAGSGRRCRCPLVRPRVITAAVSAARASSHSAAVRAFVCGFRTHDVRPVMLTELSTAGTGSTEMSTRRVSPLGDRERREPHAPHADALHVERVRAGAGQANLEPALVVAQRLHDGGARGIQHREQHASQRGVGGPLGHRATHDLRRERRARRRRGEARSLTRRDATATRTTRVPDTITMSAMRAPRKQPYPYSHSHRRSCDLLALHLRPAVPERHRPVEHERIRRRIDRVADEVAGPLELIPRARSDPSPRSARS